MDVKGSPHRGRRSRREQGAEETRAALVSTARSLFAARGYADVSIDDITEGTRVTRGALYHHFEDKRELFRAVVEAVERELTDEVRRQGEGPGGPWEQLRAACEAYLDACLRPEVQRIIVLDAPPFLTWRGWCEIDKRYGLGVFEGLLGKARDAGLLETRSVETAAQLLLGALNTGARVVADAADKAAARRSVLETIERLLAGFWVGRPAAGQRG
ncbi:TetR/AcrR family transcriptional regulator [Anaeromyxobacter diazotrophicus]|uniref:TetR family transcriptional regulator n=1 Tax=Anaeromyxobacter diazotrophicus TaxID=2590199 RepID=A0A7I9VNP8_9BACT|nr:TetR/AcrR family transcriptional regulator [Anaeromyxobacter diazotrophicus]GEJ57730.1 TetR family transcriptional regulator [Anaeromyxobacter diazotrophicus]